MLLGDNLGMHCCPANQTSNPSRVSRAEQTSTLEMRWELGLHGRAAVLEFHGVSNGRLGSSALGDLVIDWSNLIPLAFVKPTRCENLQLLKIVKLLLLVSFGRRVPFHSSDNCFRHSPGLVHRGCGRRWGV
jgi:hypothetical protein